MKPVRLQLQTVDDEKSGRIPPRHRQFWHMNLSASNENGKDASHRTSSNRDASDRTSSRSKRSHTVDRRESPGNAWSRNSIDARFPCSWCVAKNRRQASQQHATVNQFLLSLRPYGVNRTGMRRQPGRPVGRCPWF